MNTTIPVDDLHAKFRNQLSVENCFLYAHLITQIRQNIKESHTTGRIVEIYNPGIHVVCVFVQSPSGCKGITYMK